MLRLLLNSHPDLWITHEHGVLGFDGSGLDWYRHVLSRYIGILGAERSFPGGPRKELLQDLHSHFLMYLICSLIQGPNDKAVSQTIRFLRPGVKKVGDKYPDFLKDLSKIANRGLLLVIYRHPLPTIASCLRRIRNPRDQAFMPWLKDELDQVTTLSRQWSEQMRALLRLGPQVQLISYEAIRTDTDVALNRLAKVLAIDPIGFDRSLISHHKVPNHGLSHQEVELIEEHASQVWSELNLQAP